MYDETHNSGEHQQKGFVDTSPLDLLLLNRLQYLNHASAFIHNIIAIKDFAVFPSANLANYLVVLLVTAIRNATFIVNIKTRWKSVNERTPN